MSPVRRWGSSSRATLHLQVGVAPGRDDHPWLQAKKAARSSFHCFFLFHRNLFRITVTSGVNLAYNWIDGHGMGGRTKKTSISPCHRRGRALGGRCRFWQVVHVHGWKWCPMMREIQQTSHRPPVQTVSTAWTPWEILPRRNNLSLPHRSHGKRRSCISPPIQPTTPIVRLFIHPSPNIRAWWSSWRVGFMLFIAFFHFHAAFRRNSE